MDGADRFFAGVVILIVLLIALGFFLATV